MLAFHHWLDRMFQKRWSFSVFLRIWLTFVLLIVLTCSLVFYHTQKTLRPAAKRVVEDSLVDSSRLLSVMIASDLANKSPTDFGRALTQKLSHAFANSGQKLLWYDQKTKSQFHLYVTDAKGQVVYDSQNTNVGADFSRWNDVYLTLQGKYGARSTDVDGHSVMYVASPVVYQNKLIGVLSVGKPTNTLTPYLNKSNDELIKIIVSIMVLILGASLLMAWWLRHSIQTVNRYTQGLASQTPPHFYLGKELNELTQSIGAMKDTIENKAYVTEYVHTLTHELKSPITAIKASGELLADELTASERQQFSTIIKEQTNKLTHLVDSLLTLAKIEQPNFKLELTPCQLETLIQNCLDLQHAHLTKLDKTVRVIQESHTLLADRFWLSQAIQNVIDNAIHYGNHYLLIQTKQHDKYLHISIINDSHLLPDYVCQKVFDRYFSLTTHHQTTNKGTGIGLTLVKQILELHGGTASFEQLDGATFANHYPEFAIFDENFVVVTLILPKQTN